MPSETPARLADIATTIRERADLTHFASVLTAADRMKMLGGKDVFTVFAPSNEAFNRVVRDSAATLLAPQNQTRARRVTAFHIVPGVYKLEDVKCAPAVITSLGQRLKLSSGGLECFVGSGKITVHDIECSNGIIHIIDEVQAPADQTVAALLGADGRCGKFLSAVRAAELGDLVSGDWNVTVFAPTDTAIAALPTGEWDRLMLPANRSQLKAFVKQHLLSSRLYVHQALRDGTVALPNGDIPATRGDAGKITLGSASLLAFDIDGSNGVLHIIDRVLPWAPSRAKP